MKLRNKKTGEIGQIGYVATQDGQIIVEDISGQEYPYSVICSYGTLEELNKEWEDYKPKEPLIKDEKIRKAVRAWAEANELEPDYEVKYDADMYGLNSWQTDINFNYRIDGLEHNEEYTIAELCGEEEE